MHKMCRSFVFAATINDEDDNLTAQYSRDTREHRNDDGDLGMMGEVRRRHELKTEMLITTRKLKQYRHDWDEELTSAVMHVAVRL